MSQINYFGNAPIYSKLDIKIKFKAEISKQLLLLLDKLPKACGMCFLDQGKAFLRYNLLQKDVRAEIAALKKDSSRQLAKVERKQEGKNRNVNLIKFGQDVFYLVKSQEDLDLIGYSKDTFSTLKQKKDLMGAGKKDS